MGFWPFGDDDSCMSREHCINKVCDEHALSVATYLKNQNSFVMPGQFHLALGAVMVWVVCFLNVAAFAYVRQRNFWRAFLKFAMLHSKGVSYIQGMLVCSVLVQHHLMVHRDGLAVSLSELGLGPLYQLYRTLAIVNSFVESGWSYFSPNPLIPFNMDYFYKVLAWSFLAVSYLPCHFLVRSFFDSPRGQVDDWPHEFSFTGKLVKLCISFILAFNVTPLLTQLGCFLLADLLREIQAPDQYIQAAERLADNSNIGSRSSTPSAAEESKAPASSSSSSSPSFYNMQLDRHNNGGGFPLASAPPLDGRQPVHSAFAWSASRSRSAQQSRMSDAVRSVSSALSSTGSYLFGEGTRMMRDSSPAAQQDPLSVAPAAGVNQRDLFYGSREPSNEEQQKFLRDCGWIKSQSS